MVCVAANPVNRTAGEGGEGLAASDSVMEALLAMMETDYRGALRTMISTANPDLDDDTVRDRVERKRRVVPAGGRRAAHAVVGRGRGARDARARSATACGSSRRKPTRGSWRRSSAPPSCCPRHTSTRSRTAPISRPDIAASYISRDHRSRRPADEPPRDCRGYEKGPRLRHGPSHRIASRASRRPASARVRCVSAASRHGGPALRSEARAGSPLPPTLAQVPYENWYLPR